MNILYVATKGENATTISVDEEISKLEELFLDSPARFSSIASTTAESLPRQLAGREFDILHITAHGEGQVLQTLTNRGGTVLATAKQIAAFLPSHKPFLIYLNACDSEPIARELVRLHPDKGGVRFAIGNKAPLSSDYSISAALRFYNYLILGGSLQGACGVACHQAELLSSGRVSLQLHAAKNEDPSCVIPMPGPKILAAVLKFDVKRKEAKVVFGISGVPEGTVQVLFFSDDEDLIENIYSPLGGELCQVARGIPIKGEMWCDRNTEAWKVEGDFRVFAVGVTAEGRSWITRRTTLCEAAERWFSSPSVKPRKLSGQVFKAALALLSKWHVTP